MFTSTIRGKVSAAALVLGAAFVLSAGYGLSVVSAVQPDIFRLNGNVVSTFPTTRALNIGGVFTQGGGVRATSTTAAVGTIQTTDFDTESTIDFTVNVADVTLTLAATTSTSYPTVAGQSRTLKIRNASTTATADIIIAAPTGVHLKSATTTKQIYGDTDGSNYGVLLFTKRSDTDIDALLTVYGD